MPYGPSAQAHLVSEHKSRGLTTLTLPFKDLDLPLPKLNSLAFEGQTIGPSNSGIKNYTSLATILSGRRNRQCLPIPCIRLGAGLGPTEALDSLQNEMKDKIKESNGGGDVFWG